MRTRFTLSRLILATSVSTLAALTTPSVRAATFSWTGTTNGWTTASAWSPATAPNGNNASDTLAFAGDVNLPYISTNNVATNPFSINKITLNSTGFVLGNSHTISGNSLFFTGTTPTITQSGTGNFTFFTPVQTDGTVTFNGIGAGVATLNAKVSGIANIIKDGTSAFRFGTIYTQFTFPQTGPSDNTWLGALDIRAGTVRFNNNEQSGRTAVRANPVIMGSASSTFSCNSEMRFGTLSGNFGDVRTTITTAISNNPDSESIIITALTDGSYAGALTLSPPIGTGTHNGELIIRGTGTQTLSGTLTVDEDTIVGRGATLVLSGNASLASSTGSVIFGGGTLRLENEISSNDNRLREGGLDPNLSTTVQPIGGGTLILAGNAAGSAETTGRLQLGPGGVGSSNPRSGHLTIDILHRAGSDAETSLTFQNYIRDQQTLSQFATISFSAFNDNSTPQFLLLGEAGNAPRVVLTDGIFNVPLQNGLLNTTGGTGSIGWATIVSPLNGSIDTASTVDFATHTINGVAPVATIPWAATLVATDNARIVGSQATPATLNDFPVNSVKIAPAGFGQSLNIAGAGNLDSTAFLLAGNNDYTIRSSGGGGISGSGTRFFHIDAAELTLDASLAASNQPIAKSGNGVLVLKNTNNSSITQITAINGGALRATPGTTLPAGEIRLRGGVLEIEGGTFTRNLGFGSGTVNISGVKSAFVGGFLTNVAEDDDRGSGGFSAFGADATVTLSGGAQISWEDAGFARSGHALILNSPTATSMVDFTNPIVLNANANGDPNYNAREIRVEDNLNSTTDWGRVSGAISGNLYNDLLKTGAGTLELSAANTYLGHTQVAEGLLLVTGSIPSSSTVVARTNGSLGGSGSVGTILLDGGTIQPGNGVGTLTAAALYWRTGTVHAELGVGGNTSDTIALGAGKFHKDPLGAAPYKFDFGGTGEGGRTYTLATFGTTTFTAPNFSFANLRSGLTGTFAIASGKLTFATNLPAPTIATQPITQRINIGQTANFTVVTQIPGAYSYQWFKNNQPISLATSATYSISTLTAGDAGQYKVTITNGTTPVTSNTVTLTVNEAPSGTIQTVNSPEEAATPITLSGTDPNGDTLTVFGLTLPSHGTLSGSIPNIIYTGHLDYNGPDSFTFKVTDGLLDSAATTININITAVNDNPVANADAIVSDTPFDLIANDTDIDGDTPLTLLNVGTATYGTILQSGNTVTYTPGVNFTRSDSFTYTLSDGKGGQSTGTVTVGLGAPAAFGITAKGTAVSGEPVGTTLITIRQPTVSGDGSVAFVGTYLTPAKKKETALLFGNPPVPLIRLGITTAPNSTLTFAKISAPVTNASAALAFKGSLTKAPSGTANGIWARTNGITRTVAQGKMAVPGINGATFAKFGDIALPDDGRVIFAATLSGATKTTDSGIWRETGTGSVAPVVRKGQILFVGGRNRAVSTLALFGPSEKSTLGQRRGFNNTGEVLARVGFDDKTSAIIRFKSDVNITKDVAMITAVPRTELSSAQVKSFNLPVLADDGSMSFQAKLVPGTGNASSSSDTVLLRRSTAGVITLVAQEASPAINIPSSYFKSFSDTASGNNNRIAFIGTLKAKLGAVTSANDTGIWSHSQAGVMGELAREGTSAPGIDGAAFTAFKSLAWTDRPAFVAIAKSTTPKATYTGLWAEDKTGTLKLAFRTGQTVTFASGGKTVKGFTVLGPVLGALGQSSSANFYGGFAILATFTDKSTGIVTAWVP